MATQQQEDSQQQLFAHLLAAATSQMHHPDTTTSFMPAAQLPQAAFGYPSPDLLALAAAMQFQHQQQDQYRASRALATFQQQPFPYIQAYSTGPEQFGLAPFLQQQQLYATPAFNANISGRKRKLSADYCSIPANVVCKSAKTLPSAPIIPTRVERLQKRKEKKSSRERARRQAINEVYTKLDNYVSEYKEVKSVKNDSEGSSFTLDSHQRNRASILADTLEILNVKFGISYPKLDDDSHSGCAESETGSYDDGEDAEKKPKVAVDAVTQRRNKKSQREKERRQKVNTLGAKLGLMLKCTEYKDKLVVLTEAVNFFGAKGK